MSDGWLCSLSRPSWPVARTPTIRTYVLTSTWTLPRWDRPLGRNTPRCRWALQWLRKTTRHLHLGSAHCPVCPTVH
jgi:hypothetical protein